MRNLNQRENSALCANIGKQITFFNGMGEQTIGWIQGAGVHFGSFCYEVSASKNPRREFNLGGGRWFLVDPLNIIL